MNILRWRGLPALLLLDLLLLGAFAAVVWGDNAAHRGIAFTPTPTPISGGPALGVNLFNLHLEPDPAVVTRSFTLAAAMGARYARMQVPWDDIEIHGRGDFMDRRNLATVGPVSAWVKYDRIATAAQSAGIALIWRLERPPAWARQVAAATPAFQAGLLRDGNSTGPPDALADYGAFVRAVVERYDGDGVDDAPGSPQVRFFQLWNEPNLKSEWGWEEPRPEDFVALLQVGATAARAANPQVTILFPGLAPHRRPRLTCANDRTHLSRPRVQGWRGRFFRCDGRPKLWSRPTANGTPLRFFARPRQLELAASRWDAQ